MEEIKLAVLAYSVLNLDKMILFKGGNLKEVFNYRTILSAKISISSLSDVRVIDVLFTHDCQVRHLWCLPEYREMRVLSLGSEV